MKIKYKVTGLFGLSPIGEIRDAILLNTDEDSGVSLCYHPPDKDLSIGSFEFVHLKGKYYISVDKNIYSNVGKIHASFREVLKELK